MWLSILVIFCGAGFGALLRAGFNVVTVNTASVIPLGTLIANLVGGYLVGLAVAFFGNNPQFSPEWRLLIVTGFLGGLTTFSAFTAEVFQLLQKNEFVASLILVAFHVFGSLLMAYLGWLTLSFIKQ